MKTGWRSTSAIDEVVGGGLAALALLALNSVPASAATITAICEKEDAIVAGWNGPLTIIYEGDATGTLKVKTPTFALSVPAKMDKTSMEIDGKPQEATKISGIGKVATAMPDRAALDACVAAKIDPAEQGDTDAQALARMSCLSGIALTPAPVPVIAQIDFGIFPGETIEIPGLDRPRGPGIVIEIKRKYEDAAPAPGGATSIETFPAKCTLPGK